MAFENHLIGIDWINKEPYLIYRPNRLELHEEQVNLNNLESIDLILNGPRYCIGYYDASTSEHVLCPLQREVTYKKESQCYFCRSKSSTFTFAIKSLSEGQRELLLQRDSINYFSLFGKDIIKVGVASTGRKYSRILEQGAFAALIFSEGNAMQTRELESFISIEYKVIQSLNWKKKLSLLHQTLEPQRAERKLKEFLRQIKKQSENSEYLSLIIHSAEFFNAMPYYKIALPKEMEFVDAYDAFRDGDRISGQIKGIFGKILLLEIQGKVHAIHSKGLQGFLVGFNEENKNIFTSVTEPFHVRVEGIKYGAIGLFE